MLAKFVFAIVFLALFKLGYGYPALPPAFAFHPSQQQLAMAAAGIDPIMPVNYPGFTPMTAVMQSRNAITSPMPFNALYTSGRGADSAIQQQQQKLAMMAFGQQHPFQQQLFIRNNPYQPLPFRSPNAANPFMNLQGLQQPIFPPGMAIGKSAYGLHPSAAILPSDIPMDVLIGRQLVQNGLDDVSQIASSASGRTHPFPLNPLIDAGTEQQSSSFGGTFGSEHSKLTMDKAAEQTLHTAEEVTQALPQQLNPTLPTFLSENTAGIPQQSPYEQQRSVISAESAFSSAPSSPAVHTESQSSSQNSLPVFLRGAPQEFVDEFKRIIRQPNSSYADQVKRIDALVEKMDPERQLMYREFMRENDDRERLHRDRVHKTVAEMSEKAQEQFAKISATLRNPNLPDQERWDRVLQLYGKMEPDLRNEFEQKFKGFSTISPPIGI